MPTPEYSPQSTTVLDVGVEGRGEHEGGGREAVPKNSLLEDVVFGELLCWNAVMKKRVFESADT